MLDSIKEVFLLYIRKDDKLSKKIHPVLYKYSRNEIIYVHKKCYLKNSFVRSPYFVHEDESPKFFFNVSFYYDIFILYLHYLILFLPSFRGFDSKLK